MRFPSAILCLTALLPVLVAAWDHHSNYTSQCKNVSLDNGVLKASCLNNSNSDTGEVNGNTYIESQFDIELCVGINYLTAKLIFSQLGKYTEDCGPCQLQGDGGLNCICWSDGLVVNSTLDLNKGVANVNGSLACQWY
ncbi:hypothetical protein QBC44DRAFT_59444 [Cladorrhinum sp. PSN332]|nr:hypothetical protein QBC44DRAFT_59444 [Cladorrhinum sp. PSN332]